MENTKKNQQTSGTTERFIIEVRPRDKGVEVIRTEDEFTAAQIYHDGVDLSLFTIEVEDFEEFVVAVRHAIEIAQHP